MVAWVVGFLGLLAKGLHHWAFCSLRRMFSWLDAPTSFSTIPHPHYTTIPTIPLHLKENWGGCSVRHTHWFPHNAHTHTLLVPVLTLFNFAQQNTNFGSKREDAVQIWKYCKKRVNACFYWWSLFTSLHGKRQVKEQVKRGNKLKFLRGLPAQLGETEKSKSKCAALRQWRLLYWTWSAKKKKSKSKWSSRAAWR